MNFIFKDRIVRYFHAAYLNHLVRQSIQVADIQATFRVSIMHL